MSLIAAFITASGLVVAADTASTRRDDGSHSTYQKIEECGGHAVFGLTGHISWVYSDGHVDSTQTTAAAECQRFPPALPIKERANLIGAAIASFADAHFPDQFRSALEDDNALVTLIVAGYDGSEPVIAAGRVSLDRQSGRFAYRFWWADRPDTTIGDLAGWNAMSQADSVCRADPELVAGVRAPHPKSNVVLGFFAAAVTCSVDHAAELKLLPGIVNWPIDVAAFGPKDKPSIRRLVRPRG